MSNSLRAAGIINKQTTITRQQAMLKLGIRSRTTLTDGGNRLGLVRGLHYFTQEDFTQLQALRTWCERGGRKDDYAKYQNKFSNIFPAE